LSEVCADAALGDDDPMVYPDWEARAEAAEDKLLAVLKWAREQNCPWGVRTCAHAAARGHLKILKWARAHHCPWNALTCKNAADDKRLDVLRWAHENGCPWDARTCTAAVESRQLEAFKYAVEHGCPWSDDTCWTIVWSVKTSLEEGVYFVAFRDDVEPEDVGPEAGAYTRSLFSST